MNHVMDGQWTLPNRCPLVIPVKLVWALIRYRELQYEVVDIDLIGYKPLDIDTNSPRYFMADLDYPVILVKGMPNPMNKPYRMIDGRHRLLKTINNGDTSIRAFVLTEKDVERFYSLP